MKFDLVVPTYNRIEKLTRMLNSISIQDLQFINIYVYCDNSDTQTASIIKERFPFITVEIMPKQYRAFGIWNYHLQNYFTSDGLIYVCDDIEFQPETLKILYNMFMKFFPTTDGIITFNQFNLRSSSPYAMGLIGREFTNRFPNHQCFCPDYVSFYADTEMGRYAQWLRKFCYGKNCKIHHHHPTIEKNEADETHALVRDKEADIDKKVNILRRKRGLFWGGNFTLIRNEII